MRAPYSGLIFAGVLAGIAGCANGPDSVDVQAEIPAFLEEYQTALESRDAGRLRSMYVDDGRLQWVEDGAVRYRSVEDVLAGLATLPTGTVLLTEYEDAEVVRVGSSGARYSAAFRTTVGEGEAAFTFGGLMTMVLERGSDGWRIVGGHTSASRPGGR